MKIDQHWISGVCAPNSYPLLQSVDVERVKLVDPRPLIELDSIPKSLDLPAS